MQLQELATVIVHGAEIVASSFGALVVAATAIVKITPTKKDDALVESIGDGFFSLMDKAPTFGINPKTKALHDAYLAQREELEALKAQVGADQPKAS